MAEGEDGEGWYYFGARYYDAEVGLWTSTDPAKQYHSSYTYCGNNPISVYDPNGIYGLDVHWGKTLEWSYNSAIKAGFAEHEAWNLARRIADADQGVDDFNNAHDPQNRPEDFALHFMSTSETGGMVFDATLARDPEAFGAALHSRQDSYRHANRGYGFPLGHALNTVKSWFGFAPNPDAMFGKEGFERIDYEMQSTVKYDIDKFMENKALDREK